MDEVTREGKKLDNEEFNDLYFSPNIVLEELDRRGMYRIWGRREVGKPERKRPLGRSKHS